MGATGGSIPRHQENCTPHLCNKSVGRTRMARGTARASGIGKGAGAVAGHKGCFARCARTGKNLPQTRGGRMQQLCNKFARDGRSEGAAEGGGAPRMAAGRHQDRRTKGRAPIAEGTRCRAKRETTDPATRPRGGVLKSSPGDPECWTCPGRRRRSTACRGGSARRRRGSARIGRESGTGRGTCPKSLRRASFRTAR